MERDKTAWSETQGTPTSQGMVDCEGQSAGSVGEEESGTQAPRGDVVFRWRREQPSVSRDAICPKS